MAKKRPREAHNVNVEMVEIYEDLANEHENVRLRAARTLLTKLSFEQAPTTQDVEKTLIRLIKGLSSGRKSARIGFSVALTELLTQLFGSKTNFTSEVDLSIQGVLEILQMQTHPVGSLPGQEQRDLHFGRLFGLEAVIKSGILFQSDRPSALWEQVLDLILELAKKKPWLCEECGWTLYETIPTLAANNTTQSYTQAVVDRLHAHGLTKTTEGVAIWLSVRSLAPTISLPKDVWLLDDPLNVKEKGNLATVLVGPVKKEKKGQDDSVLPQKRVWNSTLHFIWGVLLAEFAETEEPIKRLLAKSKRTTRTTFGRFWIEAVDNRLFAPAASNERKFLGFQLFSKVLREQPFYQLSQIFTPNLKKCLVNQLASSDRYLHRAAHDSLKTMHARVEAPFVPNTHPKYVQPEVARLFVSNLQHMEGTFLFFDQVTKTKTIEKLLCQASNEALCEIIKTAQYMIVHQIRGEKKSPEEERKSAEVQRRYLADQLLAVVRTRNVNVSDQPKRELVTWVRDILYIFVGFAYFTPTDSAREFYCPKPVVSSSSQGIFRSRLTSCLTHLLSDKAHAQVDYAYDVVCNIRQREESDTESEALIAVDNNIRKSIKRAWKILDQIHAIGESSQAMDTKAHLRAMKLLYSLTILEVYNGTADAVSLLDELKICYNELIQTNKANKANSEASELLVEVLLSFISKPSVLFRKLAQQVFAAFASEFSSAGLKSMLNVVLCKEGTSGQQQMFDQDVEEDDDVDHDEDSSDDNNDLSDVEMVDGAGASSVDGMSDEDIDKASSEPSDTGGESSDTTNNDEADDELAAFDAKLAQALGTQRADGLLPDVSDQSSDSDMDDDQMMALEPHLTQVFKERKMTASKKKEKKDAKETVVNFKLRVLDLLSIYIKKQNQNPTALEIIKPLLEAIRSTQSSQVSRKACQVLAEYSKLCKGKDIPKADDIQSVWTLLKDVYAQALKEGSNDYANACSHSSILLCKILIRADKTNFTGIGALFVETLSQPILYGKGRVRPSLLADWSNWYSSLLSTVNNK